MSTTKRLAADAMLAAMFVCLSLVSISLPNMKITLDSLPVLVAAFLFGPLDGLAVGLTGSFLNQMLTYGFTATTLLWILPAGLRGLLVGL
jgi:ECF transporter S component (folate family)